MTSTQGLHCFDGGPGGAWPWPANFVPTTNKSYAVAQERPSGVVQRLKASAGLAPRSVSRRVHLKPFKLQVDDVGPATVFLGWHPGSRTLFFHQGLGR